MQRFLMALACLAFSASVALAADSLDAFKGQKGNLDIAGGVFHHRDVGRAARRIMTANPDIRITVAG
ncbi:MAG: phosphate ABC transporter substrate-binding protein, partial [Desulfovibrio sp.]|nr:phosphate ABC transporter substrate-binding protein [Desulfovibrio sp.]